MVKISLSYEKKKRFATDEVQFNTDSDSVNIGIEWTQRSVAHFQLDSKTLTSDLKHISNRRGYVSYGEERQFQIVLSIRK